MTLKQLLDKCFNMLNKDLTPNFDFSIILFDGKESPKIRAWTMTEEEQEKIKLEYFEIIDKNTLKIYL